MSSDDTIYHIILIYGSQCTVGNGRGERWRACNIQLYSELYISLFFSLHALQAQHLLFLASEKKIHIFVLYYVLQAANSLCQLSVGVQPFLGNMLYLLSSCVCDITVLLLCKAMNGAIIRDCQMIKILRRVGC